MVHDGHSVGQRHGLVLVVRDEHEGGSRLRVDSPEQSVAMLRDVLEGKAGAPRDIVVLNAGMALYAAGVAPSMQEGMAQARQSIDSGAALAKLQALVAFSQAAA